MHTLNSRPGVTASLRIPLTTASLTVWKHVGFNLVGVLLLVGLPRVVVHHSATSFCVFVCPPPIRNCNSKTIELNILIKSRCVTVLPLFPNQSLSSFFWKGAVYVYRMSWSAGHSQADFAGWIELALSQLRRFFSKRCSHPWPEMIFLCSVLWKHGADWHIHSYIWSF